MSFPSMPIIPSLPTIPSLPSFSSMPSFPSFPSIPSFPSMSGLPTMPSLFSMPNLSSTPSLPNLPSLPRWTKREDTPEDPTPLVKGQKLPKLILQSPVKERITHQKTKAKNAPEKKRKPALKTVASNFFSGRQADKFKGSSIRPAITQLYMADDDGDSPDDDSDSTDDEPEPVTFKDEGCSGGGKKARKEFASSGKRCKKASGTTRFVDHDDDEVSPDDDPVPSSSDEGSEAEIDFYWQTEKV